MQAGIWGRFRLGEAHPGSAFPGHGVMKPEQEIERLRLERGIHLSSRGIISVGSGRIPRAPGLRMILPSSASAWTSSNARLRLTLSDPQISPRLGDLPHSLMKRSACSLRPAAADRRRQ